jgi:hypothetical protein
MFLPCKTARIAFLGGAALALLSGCAQTPVSYRQPVTSGSAAMRAYLNAEAAAQQSAEARAAAQQYEQYQRNFDAAPPQAPVVQAPRHVHRAPAEDSPVISENSSLPISPAPVPPAPVPKAPVPKAPADPGCVGWWRICHFL